MSSQGAERTADCCYMSHTTTHYFRPAKAWEREGVTPSHRGVKMSEQRDSSCGTRSGANASAFSRREKEHIARRRVRSALCGEWRRKAQCVTRTRARESMSTPVSKTKSSHFRVSFLFWKKQRNTVPCPAKVLSVRLAVALCHAQQLVIHVPQKHGSARV